MSLWVSVSSTDVAELNKTLTYSIEFPAGSGEARLHGRRSGSTLIFNGELELAVLKGLKQVVSMELKSVWEKRDDIFLLQSFEEVNLLKQEDKRYYVNEEDRVLECLNDNLSEEYPVPDVLPLESLFDPLSFLLLGDVIKVGEEQKFGFFVGKRFYSFEAVSQPINKSLFNVEVKQEYGSPIPSQFLPNILFEGNDVKSFAVQLPLGRLSVNKSS